VRDEQDRARKRLERGLEGLAALEVEMVRRLVEDEKVRSGGNDQRQPEPTAFAARELVDALLVLVPAGEEEPAEKRLRLRPLQARGAHRAFEHAAALVELDLVLREVGELDAVADPADFAGDDPLEQRRLAGAVRSDQGDMLAALQNELCVLEEGLRACGEVEALGLDHHPAAPCRLQELEAERTAAGARRFDALSLDPGDLLQLRLSLP